MIEHAEDYYGVLGLSPDAPFEQIKAHYRLRVFAAHPDHSGEDADVERFGRFTLAYKVLSDPEQRRQYNARLKLSVEPRALKGGYDLYQRLSIPSDQALSGASVLFVFLRYDPCSLCWCEGCHRCKYVGQIPTEAQVQVNVPAGLKSQITLFIEGEGGQSEPGGPRGDLFVYVSIQSLE